MPEFYVNRNAQITGEHEVHQKDACPYPPDLANRVGVGWHASCHGAILAATSIYSSVDGCYWCCNTCHRR
jgi:hypothetical protein